MLFSLLVVLGVFSGICFSSETVEPGVKKVWRKNHTGKPQKPQGYGENPDRKSKVFNGDWRHHSSSFSVDSTDSYHSPAKHDVHVQAQDPGVNSGFHYPLAAPVLVPPPVQVPVHVPVPTPVQPPIPTPFTPPVATPVHIPPTAIPTIVPTFPEFFPASQIVGIPQTGGYVGVLSMVYENWVPATFELIAIGVCQQGISGSSIAPSWKIVWAEVQSAGYMQMRFQEYSDNACQIKSGPSFDNSLGNYLSSANCDNSMPWNSFSPLIGTCSPSPNAYYYYTMPYVAADLSDIYWEGIFPEWFTMIKIHSNHRQSTVPYVDNGCWTLSPNSPAALLTTVQTPKYMSTDSSLFSTMWFIDPVNLADDEFFGGYSDNSIQDGGAYGGFYSVWNFDNTPEIFVNCVNAPTNPGGSVAPAIYSLYSHPCAAFAGLCGWNGPGDAYD